MNFVLRSNGTVIEWLYKLGRDYQVLNMDYDEFTRIMKSQHKDYHEGVKYRVKRRYRYYGNYGHHCAPEVWRVLRSFKWTGQTKKTKEDTPRKDWRRKKRFSRDKKKLRCWYSGSSVKKNVKHFAARKHRMRERWAIAHEQWDELSRRSYKEAEDIWSWD
jgi:hypothetical protein